MKVNKLPKGKRVMNVVFILTQPISRVRRWRFRLVADIFGRWWFHGEIDNARITARGQGNSRYKREQVIYISFIVEGKILYLKGKI